MINSKEGKNKCKMYSFKGSIRKFNVGFQVCDERDKGMKERLDQKWNKVWVVFRVIFYLVKIIFYIKKMF